MSHVNMSSSNNGIAYFVFYDTGLSKTETSGRIHSKKPVRKFFFQFYVNGKHVCTSGYFLLCSRANQLAELVCIVLLQKE